MQIVINIPEWFKEMIDEGEVPCNFPPFLAYGIQHGIVLPKGHGRLIDSDKILSETADMEGNLPDEKDKQSVRFLRFKMESADVVVRADSEDK